MHDLVLRGGALLDGTGDRHAQVGGRAGAAHREVDAAGLPVTPG